MTYSEREHEFTFAKNDEVGVGGRGSESTAQSPIQSNISLTKADGRLFQAAGPAKQRSPSLSRVLGCS